MADNIVPVPKQNPVRDVNKHLRPISLTPTLSKIAEEFIVELYMKQAVLKVFSANQFGSVPKSSTTHALISMIHTWTKHTDGNGATVQVVLFDYRKALDLIDHSILTSKLGSLDIPYGIASWIVDFLKCRQQRVKLDHDCKSEWKHVPAAVPQGTKLGPSLFVLMIDNIEVTDNALWKFVDDTTIAEPVHKDELSTIQYAVSEIATKSHQNKFQLNEEKCKELRISFSKKEQSFAPFIINEKAIETVVNIKLLGLNIANDLK